MPGRRPEACPAVQAGRVAAAAGLVQGRCVEMCLAFPARTGIRARQEAAGATPERVGRQNRMGVRRWGGFGTSLWGISRLCCLIWRDHRRHRRRCCPRTKARPGPRASSCHPVAGREACHSRREPTGRAFGVTSFETMRLPADPVRVPGRAGADRGLHPAERPCRQPLRAEERGRGDSRRRPSATPASARRRCAARAGGLRGSLPGRTSPGVGGWMLTMSRRRSRTGHPPGGGAVPAPGSRASNRSACLRKRACARNAASARCGSGSVRERRRDAPAARPTGRGRGCASPVQAPAPWSARSAPRRRRPPTRPR